MSHKSNDDCGCVGCLLMIVIVMALLCAVKILWRFLLS